MEVPCRITCHLSRSFQATGHLNHVIITDTSGFPDGGFSILLGRITDGRRIKCLMNDVVASECLHDEGNGDWGRPLHFKRLCGIENTDTRHYGA